MNVSMLLSNHNRKSIQISLRINQIDLFIAELSEH